MFSFREGRPLAKILGGEYDGEIVYIKNDDDDEKKPCCKKCSKKCEKKPCCGGCRMCCEEDEKFNEIEIEDGKFIQIPSVNERSVNYISGPSGSGKSYCATGLARSFKKIYPEKDLYVFQEQMLKMIQSIMD